MPGIALLLGIVIGRYFFFNQKPHSEFRKKPIIDEMDTEEITMHLEGYKQLFEYSPLAVFIIHGLDWVVLDANQKALDNLGYSKRGVVGLKVKDIMGKNLDSFIKSMELDPLSGKTESTIYDGNILSKDGDDLPVEIHLSVLNIRQIPMLFAVVKNLKEHRDLQNKLSENQLLFSEVIDNLPLALFVIGLDGKYKLVNHYMASLMEKIPDDIIGEKIVDISPSRFEDTLFVDLSVLQNEAENLHAIEHISLDDEMLTFDVQIFPLLSANGDITASVGIARNITKMIKTEAALSVSEQQFSQLFTHAPLAIGQLGFGGEVEFFNEEFKHLFGDSQNSDTYMQDFIYQLDMPFFEESLEMVTNEISKPISRVFRFKSKNDKLIFAKTYLRSVPYGFRDRRIMLILEDITEQRNIEKELKQAQKMEVIGQMTGGIAHDFNNILSSIMGYTQLALEDLETDPDQVEDSLKIVEKAAMKAAGLIKQLLTISGNNEGKFDIMPMAPMIEETLKIARSALPAQIDIMLSIDAISTLVEFDPVQLHQIILNLLINAKDAMNGTGIIDLSVFEKEEKGIHFCNACKSPIKGDWLSLNVSDSGSGIPENILKKMFEPFFTTKDIGKGTGMGLSMVNRIIHDHGGHVLVQTKIDEGTVFKLFFPLMKKDADALSSKIEDIKKHSNDATGGHVVVLDDESDILHLLNRQLSRAGYKVTTFSRPREFVRTVMDYIEDIDLLITDYSMPQLSGTEVINKLAPLKYIPCIILTGNDLVIEPEIRAHPMVKHILCKPMDHDVFLAKVASAIKDTDSSVKLP